MGVCLSVATKLQADWSDSKAAVGMMLCLNGKIYSAELYPTHQAFEARRMDTFGMYGLSSILESPGPGKLNLEDCQAYLEAVVESSRSTVGRANNSVLWGLSDPRLLAIEGSMAGASLEAGGAARPGFLYGLYLPR